MNNYTMTDPQGKPFMIECEDIVLREYMLEDLDAIYKITHEPEIRQYLRVGMCRRNSALIG